MTAIVSSFLFSCSSHSVGSSFTSRLDVVDAFIGQGNTQDSVKELSALEKVAFSPFERIAIFKRYELLGEHSRAEKYIKASLKKLPSAKELTALYTHLLLSQNRLSEALKVSRSLKGSEYESLYAESALRFASESPTDLTMTLLFGTKTPSKKEMKKSLPLSEEERALMFRDGRFVPVYEMAWNNLRSLDEGASVWLVNAAVLHMKEGQYGEGAALYPGKIFSGSEGLFWGKVLYDSGYYDMALEALLSAKNMELSFSEKVELLALCSDAFFVLGEDESSQTVRTELLALEKENDWDYSGELSKILPAMGVNSVLYSLSHDETLEGYAVLTDLVSRFPDYEPALASYGAMAVTEAHRPKEDEISSAIRKAGLKTLSMEKEEALPHVTLDSAIEKTRLALKKNPNADLAVLKEKLTVERDASGDKLLRSARVWKLLEENSTGPNRYPPEIVHYAVATLIDCDCEGDAEGLFEGHLQGTYSSADEAFVPSEHPESLSLWECETAAWFAGRHGKTADCLRLYSYIIENYGERTPVHSGLGENNVLVHAFTNLAVVYASTARDEDALYMLNKASGRATDALTKAEILYRMASLSDGMGDSRSAIRSLQYALNLNPDHHKARLLLKKKKH